MNITVTFRGTSHPLSLLPDSTLEALQLQLEELTSIPSSLQKLLYKGKKPRLAPDVTLVEAGLKDGMKIQLLGSTESELGGMKKAEDEKRRREEILSQRAKQKLPKPRSTSSPNSAASQYKFHNIVPLAHLPEPHTAHSMLSKLAADPAILHVMQKHQFAVGVLTELAPHEQPHLLGLNVNAGQAIKLRIRTDVYDGFRLYSDIRKVLCHELAHNVWGEHDNNFKALNSQLNKEVIDFENAQRVGAHTLAGSGGPVYEPAAQPESEAQSYVLGGPSAVTRFDTRDERRRRALEAAVTRLRREEEELEESCGTAAGPGQNSGSAPTDGPVV